MSSHFSLVWNVSVEKSISGLMGVPLHVTSFFFSSFYNSFFSLHVGALAWWRGNVLALLLPFYRVCLGLCCTGGTWASPSCSRIFSMASCSWIIVSCCSYAKEWRQEPPMSPSWWHHWPIIVFVTAMVPLWQAGHVLEAGIYHMSMLWRLCLGA